MRNTLIYHTPTYLIAVLLIIFMLLFYYLGQRVKENKRAKAAGHYEENLGAVEGSMLGLLTLLLSFTFSMSSSRHDTRYDIIVAEASSIKNAVLRADFFVDSERAVMRSYFKEYVNARIAEYDAANNVEKTTTADLLTESAAQQLWKLAVNATKSNDAVYRNSGSLFANSLNEMIYASAKRKAARNTHVPESILYLLFLLCLSSSFIVGYGSKRKPDIIIAAGFAITISFTVFSILDLDRPYRGFITLDKAEQNIAALKELLD